MPPAVAGGRVCRLGDLSARARVACLCCLIALTAGCAVHYSNQQSGAEHLWGFGRLSLVQQPSGGGLATVVTGVSAPGLCLEIGRDHFGLTFGYLNRQQLLVVATNAMQETELPTVAPGFLTGGNPNAPWALGHLRMRTVAFSTRPHHYAVVTGKALAGLGASLGSGDNSLGLVLDGRQRAVVFDENIRLDFDQDAPRWPGFDLLAARVHSIPENPETQIATKGEP